MNNEPATRDTAKPVARFDITKRLVARLQNDEAVIGGIGHTNFDLWAAGRRPQNFYMLGSMGLAIPIALGVAIVIRLIRIGDRWTIIRGVELAIILRALENIKCVSNLPL